MAAPRSSRAGQGAAALAGLVGAVLLTGCGDGSQPIPDADQLYIDAQDHLAAGDVDQALASLDASIAAEPTEWALLERAKLLAQRGDDAAARADCDALLALSPDNADVPWLKGELQKPAAQRFQGPFQAPPSAAR